MYRQKKIVSTSILVTMLSVGGATAMQEAAPVATPAGGGEIISLTGSQVPYAFRAASYLDRLAFRLENTAEGAEGGMASAVVTLAHVGIDPESAAARQLCELALEYKRAMGPEDGTHLVGLDAESLARAQEAQTVKRMQLAGQAMGRWLRDRDHEGADVEELFKRLLRPSVASISTTDPELDFVAIARHMLAFEAAVRAELGYIPNPMLHWRPDQPQVAPTRLGGDIIDISDRQVPYAFRAASLLNALAGWQEAKPERGMAIALSGLGNRGLDPASPAARQLCEVALELNKASGLRERTNLLGHDDESLARANEKRNIKRMQVVGHALGRWLRERDREGADLDALLGKLLDSGFSSVAISTNDPELNFVGMARHILAFEEAVQAELGYIPTLMRHWRPEER